MPVELFEIPKIIICIILIIVPGYLWSLFLFKEIKPFERLVFGLIIGLGITCSGLFLFDVILGMQITASLVYFLFVLYFISSVILYTYLIYKSGPPKLNLEFLKRPKFIILVLILIFTVFMIFLPHLSNGYYLPFHVDEWEHLCYSRAFIESGSSIHTNPYTGNGISQPLELGLHYITGCIKWISGASFNSIFVFMPSIIAVFTGIAVFNIGDRSERKFGLEGAFLVSFIPTTCRMMGPSFFVPVTLGLLFVTFIIWLGQIRKILAIVFIPFFIWCAFLIHPPTALACLIITLIFSILLISEKEYKLATLTSSLSLIPIAIIFMLTTRWDYSLQEVIDAFFGGKYFSELNLPNIWPSFDHLGIVTWIFCIIGAYFAFKRGKILHRTISLSVIVFIAIIGFYDKFGYGIPIMYERSFLYLFLVVAIIAGYGISEIREVLINNKERIVPKKYKFIKKNIGIIVPIVVSFLLISTAIPAHLDIPYYRMIEEDDYEAFIWIRDNIESYRDENNSYERAAVDPFIASPFSAVTGLYTISSTMSPLYGYDLHPELATFFSNKCVDTNFLKKYEISIVYGSCNNDNLTLIHPNIYIYSTYD